MAETTTTKTKQKASASKQLTHESYPLISTQTLWSAVAHAPSPCHTGRWGEGEKGKGLCFPTQSECMVASSEANARGKLDSPSDNHPAAGGALLVVGRALPPGSFGLAHLPPRPPTPSPTATSPTGLLWPKACGNLEPMASVVRETVSHF